VYKLLGSLLPWGIVVQSWHLFGCGRLQWNGCHNEKGCHNERCVRWSPSGTNSAQIFFMFKSSRLWRPNWPGSGLRRYLSLRTVRTSAYLTFSCSPGSRGPRKARVSLKSTTTKEVSRLHFNASRKRTTEKLIHLWGLACSAVSTLKGPILWRILTSCDNPFDSILYLDPVSLLSGQTLYFPTYETHSYFDFWSLKSRVRFICGCKSQKSVKKCDFSQ